MRRKLMIALLTMTMMATLFVGCGNSETSEVVETPVEEETVEEETTDVETEEVTEEPETTEVEENTTDKSETVAKPKASTNYKEWKEKQEEVEEEPEVAESKEETKTKTDTKKETTTTASATTNTTTTTNANTSTPEPSNDNTTIPVAETPAPAVPSNNGEHVHNWVSTYVTTRYYEEPTLIGYHCDVCGGMGSHTNQVIAVPGPDGMDVFQEVPCTGSFSVPTYGPGVSKKEDIYANVCSICGATQ